LPAPIDIEARLQRAVQAYWQVRADNSTRQRSRGKADAGTRGEVTGGGQMAALEGLIADLLEEAGIRKLDIRTRSALELPGYFRATKKWDLVVCADGRLVLAMEFKSQAGKSIGNNVNNRSEEAVGSAKDLWTAFREGRLGRSTPVPFLGYLFLLEDRDSVKRPVANKEPHFKVDPVFSRAAAPRSGGASYAERYEWLCRRLVLERLYSASCFLMATPSSPTVVTQPAPDLSFGRFVGALRGHALTFLETRG
jgi:hypothetical protein